MCLTGNGPRHWGYQAGRSSLQTSFIQRISPLWCGEHVEACRRCVQNDKDEIIVRAMLS
jgi:hypothetical protein